MASSNSTRTSSQASFVPGFDCPPLCYHNIACEMFTCTTPPKKAGRRFYGCASWEVDDCEYRKWIDHERPGQRSKCAKECGRNRQVLKEQYERLGRDRDGNIAKLLKENATQAADIARVEAKLGAAESTLEAYKKGALFLSVCVFVVFAYCLVAY